MVGFLDEPFVAGVCEPQPGDPPEKRALLEGMISDKKRGPFALGFEDGLKGRKNWDLGEMYQWGYRAGKTQHR